MSLRRLAAVAIAATLATIALGGAGPAAAAEDPADIVIGHSVQGREITARHLGDPAAPVQIVVLGQMHGNEEGGRKVVTELLASPIPAGIGVWVVPSLNPDGYEADTRVNAHGVDLNRNFPAAWRQQRRGTEMWSGPRAESEPETRAMRHFLERVRPAALISFHQAFDLVDVTHPHSRQAGRLLARWMGERAASVPCAGPCHGTLTQWVDRHLGAVALTVELDSRVSPAEARRAAGAVLRLGRWLGR